MFGGVLRNLLGDAAEGALANTARKTVGKTATRATSKAVLPDENLLKQASSYLSKGAKTDKHSLPFIEADIPVGKLTRREDFQPRTTASGKGTENSVFTRGYDEGLVDQPMLVRKSGDTYEVLGGHSRTLGMERRAAEGLPNPENVRARIYEGISDADAKQISRAANQGGQYESTLDMAKSISDSLKDGVTPSVQKQNMTRGFSYDDYKYLWDAVADDNMLRNKLFQGAISQDDVLSVARHARSKGLEPDKARQIVDSLDRNGTFTKQNARNVVNLVTGKTKAGLMKEAQTGLFGDIDTAVNAVDLLKDLSKTSSELTRRTNAIKAVSGEEGLSKEVMSELDEVRKGLEKKMNNISDELLERYGRQKPVGPMPAAVDAEPQSMGLFGDAEPTVTTPQASKVAPKVPEAPKDRKINVLKINDNTVGDDVAVKYLTPNKQAPTMKRVMAKSAPAPVRKTMLNVQAMQRALPEPGQIRNMSDEELKKAIPLWRDTMAGILTLQATIGSNN